MTVTKTIDGKELAAELDKLRSAGATDDQLADLSAKLDDLAISRGNTQGGWRSLWG